MVTKTKPFDAAKHFATDEHQVDLIADALETGHAGYIAAARRTVARARGTGDIAAKRS